MNKKYSIASVIGGAILVVAVLTFVIIKFGPDFHGNSVSNPISEPTTNESTTDSATGWTTYQSSACGTSYAVPPGWVSQGWAADGEIINLSSPDDTHQDEINPRMSDAGPSPAPISFYVNCTNDVASVFVGQDEALIENGATVEAALAKGLLRDLKNARYIKTLKVAGQPAFLYEIGSANSGPDGQYNSIFVHVKNRWIEIRPSMTRFADITQDQRGILDSIRILDTK
jgi:hypothetical protein